MAYHDDILALNPMLYWRFQETSGTQATDASGNGYHGTIDAGITLGDPGPISGTTAFTFDGSSGLAVTRDPFPTDMNDLTEFAIVFFIKSAWVGQDYTILTNAPYDADDRLTVYCNSSSQLAAYIKCTTTGALTTLTAMDRPPLAAWSHVVLTNEGGSFKVYVNGKPYGGSDSSESNFPIFDAAARFEVGSSSWYTPNGSIAEVALIPSGISAAQAASLAAYLDPEVTDWKSAISKRWPLHWWRLGEVSGDAKDINAGDDAAWIGSPTYGSSGATADADTAMLLDGSADYATAAMPASLYYPDSGNYSIGFWVKTSNTSSRKALSYGNVGASNNSWDFLVKNDEVQFRIRNAFGTTLTNIATGLDLTDWTFVCVTHQASGQINKLFIDGVLENTETSFNGMTVNAQTLAFGADSSGGFKFEGGLDDIIFFGETIPDADVLEMFDVTQVIAAQSIRVRLRGYLLTAAQTIPLWLRDFALAPAQTVPLRLKTSIQVAAANIGVRLRTPDPSHYTAAGARWSPKVVLGGTDISATLWGTITITHEENSSGLAEFVLLPATGPVDPNDYERKQVMIDFEGRNSAGALLYASRRYTGVTTSAVYDPDAGTVTVQATTDLQGRLEQLEREQIMTIVGGSWSEHVFDDTADGYQYAQDVLSTIPAEMHVNNYGAIMVVPYAAKATPDTTLTDANRFNDTLTLTRATRRDLVTRMRVNFDFRFTRLRHREIQCAYIGPTFCDFMDGKAAVATKEVILSAVDSNEWVRISDVTFVDLPPTGTYCGGKNWVAYQSEPFCLEARWRAARRWAQTITEAYQIDVYAPDIEEAIGQQMLSEDYGVEAVYDATNFEQIREYSAAPSNSSLSTASNDWQFDAINAERTGRTAVQAAQVVAIEKAKTAILTRARRNVASVGNVYDPSITLEKTVRINTPYFVCKGKVRRVNENLNLVTGEPAMTVELALSRHGGSGLGVTDPTDTPEVPAQTQEESTSRRLQIGYRSGGQILSEEVDDETWTGWITNAYGATRTHPEKMYRERFVLEMPEVEETARQATEEQAQQFFELAVPQDELTMSN